VGLLRAVNVGGHGKVAMTDLRGLAEELGYSEVRTFLQSGNLVFHTGSRPTAELEAGLENAARDRFGLTTDFIVRTAEEMGAIRLHNPFPDEAQSDPAHLVTVFLKERPAPGSERRLRAAVDGPERARLVGPHAYIVYPEGIGRSRLTLPVIERQLGARGTGRNWNTVTKLAALALE
jgi:uncharacterized protein (DUF1697 family)